MARDKSKDDKLFSCSQSWEIDYVASLYGTNKEKVAEFLKKRCEDGTIKNFTHMQVYQLIKKEFEYSIPD